ncbi:hypothetical protein ABVK25_007621 [Lepraria finkii]|uniref:Uncharacterized protein n=1 Tax=Lepraria finkii TaxID=1340010 RepID=A0ABR4B2U6_9LECA
MSNLPPGMLASVESQSGGTTSVPAGSFETPEEYVRAVQKNLEDMKAAEKRVEVQLAIREREDGLRSR